MFADKVVKGEVSFDLNNDDKVIVLVSKFITFCSSLLNGVGWTISELLIGQV